MRFPVCLGLLAVAACGAASANRDGDASALFGSPPDASGDTARSGRHDATTSRDAGSGDAPAHDAGSYFADCDAGCAACSGVCSAGQCLEKVLSVTTDEGIVNDRIVVDSTSLYWMGGPPTDGGGALGYTIWRADKSTGAYGVVASSLQTPDAGFIIQEPVAGGFGAVFYSTVGPTASGPAQVFGVWPDAGPRNLPSPTVGLVGGLAVNDGGLYATFSDNPPMTGSVVDIPVTGGSPITLYSKSLTGVSGIGAIAVNRTHVAWVLGTTRPFSGIFTGSLDGSTPPLRIASAGDLGKSFLVMDSTYVYWYGATLSGVTDGPSTIYRAPIAGGPEETFLVDGDIASFAVDDASFYWTSAHPTGVQDSPFTYSEAKTSTATAGAPRTLLACVAAGGIAVDDVNVYIASAGGVLRRAK